MITSCGAVVSEVDSGAAFLVEIRRATQEGQPYGVVLLDMRMPEMDGLGVVQRIREEHLAVEPLILMLSSDDLKPQLVRLKEFGKRGTKYGIRTRYLPGQTDRAQGTVSIIQRLLEQANHHRVDELPARHANAAAPSAPATARKRILVAEDSPDNRLLIGAYLRRETCQIDFAEDGEQAVARFVARDDYDMIFMDIQMPRMDGLRATERIRQIEAEQGRRPLPIIALSASALEEDVTRALDAGCSRHISKPVEKRMLLDAIHNAGLLPPISEHRSSAPAPRANAAATDSLLDNAH